MARTIIKDGRFVVTAQISTLLARFKDGDVVDVQIRKYRGNRSTNQCRYYFGVVVSMIAAETGHEDEEIHEYCKARFLGRQFVTVLGEEIEVAKSTTRLSTEEFEDYLEKIRAWAGAELSIRIPLPHEG